jgi:hypothetical protein
MWYKYDVFSTRKRASDTASYLKALNRTSKHDGAEETTIVKENDKSYSYALKVRGGAFKRGVTHKNIPDWSDVESWLRRR